MKVHVIVEPQWLKELPASSNLNARDVVALFGYSKVESLWASVAGGYFPSPDWRRGGAFVLSKTKHGFWKVSTIRKEIKRRLASEHRNNHATEHASEHGKAVAGPLAA